MSLVGDGKFSKQQQQTKVVKNNGTPYWNETFTLNIIDQNNPQEDIVLMVLGNRIL